MTGNPNVRPARWLECECLFHAVNGADAASFAAVVCRHFPEGRL